MHRLDLFDPSEIDLKAPLFNPSGEMTRQPGFG
jgi:hypothetical protein